MGTFLLGGRGERGFGATFLLRGGGGGRVGRWKDLFSELKNKVKIFHSSPALLKVIGLSAICVCCN